MSMPRARTRSEAYVYMDLVPCPCGENEFAPDVDVLDPEPPRVLRYVGECPRCGRSREFVFELAEPPAAPPTGYVLGYGDEPSTIIDAGQWLLVAEMCRRVLEQVADSGESLTASQVPAVHDTVLLAAAAVDEIRKFLPAGAEELPADAFWTEQGRAVRSVAGELLRPDELAAARARRWAAVAEFEALYGIDEDDDADDEPSSARGDVNFR
ncbi:hypothetical protein [Actinocatenispora sera]|uniref:Uncharacterized protein n=1 Tax=Actinocatenispora sera TaxID=390989 RepID=A0A810LDV9_9ACTN|nr:hypothetical protein [Actinocatenispora sera]BCJ32406.1 hypothetical protein Asera_65140 [Actinocatenispora sera]